MPEEQKQPESAAAERPAGTTAAGPTLLDKIVLEGKMVRDPSQTPYAKDLIEEFVGQVLDEGMVVSRDTVTSIKTRIGQLDELLSRQLNVVMHSAEFQALEAAWRGLHYLVMNSETGTQLKIRVLNITKQEIVNDLEKASEFDQSTLFKCIYEAEYGTFGGNPFSVLIGDFEFGRMPQDIATLEKIGGVAATAHAPFIASASPKLFDWDSFTEMNAPRDLSKGFETAELIKWRSFRATEDSRYVALVLPHVLLRVQIGRAHV